MGGNESGSASLLGSLRTVDGVGIVRVEYRYDTDIDNLWSAITDPVRLARWHSRLEGELRPGGEFRIYVDSDDWAGTGHVEQCERPRHFVVTTRESDESWQKGQGVAPFDATLEATLVADGHHTILVVEVKGIPLDSIAYYGVGWQIHAENLAAYLAGRERGDVETRWDDLLPSYLDLAAALGQ
jgi:uncharacterized protein YndB with AHSA1/START domain